MSMLFTALTVSYSRRTICLLSEMLHWIKLEACSIDKRKKERLKRTRHWRARETEKQGRLKKKRDLKAIYPEKEERLKTEKGLKMKRDWKRREIVKQGGLKRKRDWKQRETENEERLKSKREWKAREAEKNKNQQMINLNLNCKTSRHCWDGEISLFYALLFRLAFLFLVVVLTTSLISESPSFFRGTLNYLLKF